MFWLGQWRWSGADLQAAASSLFPNLTLPILSFPKLVTLKALRLRRPIKRQASVRAHQHPVRIYFSVQRACRQKAHKLDHFRH